MPSKSKKIRSIFILYRFFITSLLIIVTFLVSCSEKDPKKSSVVSDRSKKESPDSILNIPPIDRDNSWVPFNAKHSFDSFPSSSYSGKLAKPDFSSVEYGRDPEFKAFMNERINGVSINFAGRYTIIEKSCGALCVAIYIVDRKTGKIFDHFPGDDGRWGFNYRHNSFLLLANSSLLNDSMTMFMNGWSMKPEFYHWTGKAFKLLP